MTEKITGSSVTMPMGVLSSMRNGTSLCTANSIDEVAWTSMKQGVAVGLGVQDLPGPGDAGGPGMFTTLTGCPSFCDA